VSEKYSRYHLKDTNRDPFFILVCMLELALVGIATRSRSLPKFTWFLSPSSGRQPTDRGHGGSLVARSTKEG